MNGYKKGEPVYYQIYKEMKNKILSQQWTPGKKIPNENELCTLFNVSRTTVRKAIEYLVQDNLVNKQQGKGTFVSYPNKVSQKLESVYTLSDEITKSGKGIRTEVSSVEVLDVNQIDSEKAKSVFADQVVLIKRIRYIDNDPIMIESNYFPFKDFHYLLKLNLEGKQLYKTLENDYNVHIDVVLETFRAYRIELEEAKLLHTDDHMYGLLIDRISYSSEKVVSFSQIISKGDILEFSIKLKN